jgi:uncharacterized Zn-binding protein involved in type VI secretion
MPAVALKDGQSIVACTDGTQGSVCETNLGTPVKWNWDVPFLSVSDEGSTSVKVDGYGVVLEGSAMEAHPDGAVCVATPVNHAPVLSPPAGGTVYVEGKLVGRVGDKYNVGTPFDHTITTGSSTVFIG